MKKYTNALYPDKINDLVDNDGNVNIKQQPWTIFQLKYSFEDLITAITNQELCDQIEKDLTSLFGDFMLDLQYGEFITSDNITFKGTYGSLDLSGIPGTVDYEHPLCLAGFKDDRMIRIYNGVYDDPETGDSWINIKIEGYRVSQIYDEEYDILYTDYEPLVTE